MASWAFAAAPGRVGRDELGLCALHDGVHLAGWTRDQAARVLLLLARPDDDGFLPALDLLPSIGLILVLFVGGHQVLDGGLSLGDLVEFNIYIGLLIWPLRSLGQIIASAQRASASAQRSEVRAM